MPVPAHTEREAAFRSPPRQRLPALAPVVALPQTRFRP